MKVKLYDQFDELNYELKFPTPTRTSEPNTKELEFLKEQCENADQCACEEFKIDGNETFFIPKERIAILIYNTNYDEGPIWVDHKEQKKHFDTTPTMKDDYKKIYMILIKL